MNEELIGKLKEAKSVEDVVAVAKQYGKELTLEQAKVLLDRVKAAVTGELSDEDLAAVAGGAVDPKKFGEAMGADKHWLG